MHLLKLFDSVTHNFLDLEEQECVLAKELSGEVFILVVVH